MRAVSYTSKCDSLVEIMRLFVCSRSTVQVDYLAGLKRFISQLYDNYAAGHSIGMNSRATQLKFGRPGMSHYASHYHYGSQSIAFSGQ